MTTQNLPASHISELGPGGWLIIHALRNLVWAFSEGRDPSPCVRRSLQQSNVEAGLPAMIRLLVVLREGARETLYFGNLQSGRLTAAETRILSLVETRITSSTSAVRFEAHALVACRADELAAVTNVIGKLWQQADLKLLAGHRTSALVSSEIAEAVPVYQ